MIDRLLQDEISAIMRASGRACVKQSKEFQIAPGAREKRTDTW